MLLQPGHTLESSGEFKNDRLAGPTCGDADVICLVVGGDSPGDSDGLLGLTATTLGESRAFLRFSYPTVLYVFKETVFFPLTV